MGEPILTPMQAPITMEEYGSVLWPTLRDAVVQLLTLPPGTYNSISYAKMYTCVYRCVCQKFSERLYNDLIKLIAEHLDRVSRHLQYVVPNDYINAVFCAMDQYAKAMGAIVPIFNYMSRFYMEDKLRTTLEAELCKLFVNIVTDRHVSAILQVLTDATTKPFSISPVVMHGIISQLYALKPGYSSLHPHLFARYIPGILPPMQESELEQYIAEVKRMQADLRHHPGFISGDTSRKRARDEEDDSLKPSTSSSFTKMKM